MKLVIEQLHMDFTNKQGQVLPALRDINLTIAEEDFVALVGPSGCGKSTLLNLTAGLLQPSSGTIKFVEAQHEPRMATVFQETGLFPWRNVWDNIAFGLEAAGYSPQQLKETVAYYVQLVGLSGFEQAFPHQLSGGMRQRVGIARALAIKPDLLLMDEPFSALDAQTRTIMQEELMALWEKTHLTTLYVTHNIQEAVMLADKIVLMSRRPGQIRDILTVDLPRAERSLPQHAEEIAAYVQAIWQHISSDAHAALLEVEENV